jgi:hypothetical protein
VLSAGLESIVRHSCPAAGKWWWQLGGAIMPTSASAMQPYSALLTCTCIAAPVGVPALLAAGLMPPPVRQQWQVRTARQLPRPAQGWAPLLAWVGPEGAGRPLQRLLAWAGSTLGRVIVAQKAS